MNTNHFQYLFFSNFAQDLEAKDMNRPVDEMRFDISDPRNPLNMRKRGKT